MIRYKIYQNQQKKGLNAGKWFARQKPTTAGGGSDSGDNPDPKPDGGGEAPDPAA